MKKILSLAALSVILFSSCKKTTEVVGEFEGKATVSFDSKVGTSDFALGTDFTIGTKTYNFSRLRYWISNVSLVDNKGVEYAIPNSYYLLEEVGNITLTELSDPITYPARKREDVTVSNIPVGDYKTIKFSIGVDSKYNNNMSLQAGELSQYSGMTNVSWMWLTSYIFTNLQGTVKEGTTTKTFKAETGLNANYKSVSLDLPKAVRISTAKPTSIKLNLDVTKILDGIDLIATPKIGASQATVMATLAGNYATKAVTVTSAE
jgi:hypothetical protein